MSGERPVRRRGPAPQPRVEVDGEAPLVLAVDTSGPVEGIAVVQGELVLAAWSGRRPGRSGSGLVGRIQQVLQWSGRDPSQLDALAGVTGPGAFTGLRVGLATLRGMATALEVPSFGYSSPEVWAAAYPAARYPVAVTLDARRKEVYTALLSVAADGSPTCLMGACLEAPQIWFEKLADSSHCSEGVLLAGDGARLYRDLAIGALGARAHLAGATPPGASVSWMARDVVGRLAAGEGGDEALHPLYLRDHDAALAKVATS